MVYSSALSLFENRNLFVIRGIKKLEIFGRKPNWLRTETFENRGLTVYDL